ncbi:hypothetical protein [Hymenobacter algoricola]|uniref:Glycosyltransferase RgtA/B/C/D-like domain-containing protein n=1 Tax=Hymenobacter algoricola TaxID=486267 RepID=A0ABP7NAP8_9BACT
MPSEPEAWTSPNLRRRPLLLPAAIFLVFAGYLLGWGFQGYMPYDAEEYWRLAGLFYQDGHFSLFHYRSETRGYLFPLLLFGPKAVAHLLGLRPVYMAALLGAGCAAGLFGWLGPALYQAVSGEPRVPTVRRVAFAALGFLFWRGHFNFALSDFPALTLLLASLLLLARGPGRLGWVGAGLCFAAAANIRPVYSICLPGLVLLAALPRRPAGGWGVATGLFGLGAALILGPQLLLNLRQYHRPTPLVIAKIDGLGVKDLYLAQLWWGITTQKTEGRLGKEYPRDLVLYADPGGERVLAAEQLPTEKIGPPRLTSYGQYLALVGRHPAAFAAIYARHLFNGLDVQHPTPYVAQVWRPGRLLAWANYTLWFAALLLVWRGRRPGLGRRPAVVVGTLLLPCLAALPLVVECRFLLPLHLLAYGAVCFGWPATSARRPAGPLVGAYLIFVLGCGWQSARTYATLEFREPAARTATRAGQPAPLKKRRPSAGVAAAG